VTGRVRATYVVVVPHIVGNVEDWSTVYSFLTRNRRWPTRDQAIREGIRELDHDDFLLAIVEGDTVVGVAWQAENRGTDPGDLSERAEIAQALGLRAALPERDGGAGAPPADGSASPPDVATITPAPPSLNLARNIVNQLGDLWAVPVAKRQATNDQADQFVASLITLVLPPDTVATRLREQAEVLPTPPLPGWFAHAADGIVALARPEHEVKAEALENWAGRIRSELAETAANGISLDQYYKQGLHSALSQADAEAQTLRSGGTP
jgi:hypothetical protein